MATSPVKTKPLVETIRKSEVFRKELTPWFPVREVKTIMRAYKISKYGHRDQTRHNGDRYFDHPKAVSLIIFKELKINDSESIVIALLHDVIEDSYLLDEETMEMIFGRSATNGVRIVSKDDYNKPVYYERLERCGLWRALLVKVCDRLHNMRSLGDTPKGKQTKQAKETREHFFRLCDILEKHIPKKYRHVVPYLKEKLDALCVQYGE